MRWDGGIFSTCTSNHMLYYTMALGGFIATLYSWKGHLVVLPSDKLTENGDVFNGVMT
jgi:hypothetical protein